MTRLGTALFGCGRVGIGYADDPVMARHYPYATHAQALASHPSFEWIAAVDVNIDSAKLVASRFGLRESVASARQLRNVERIEVAVLATPPGERVDIVASLPSLRAVLVEKPLGRTIGEAEEFVAACRERKIKVQVNLPRRADRSHRRLADGALAGQIGAPQGAFLLYGNGLTNNGTHMVDLVRMLLGEVAEARVVDGAPVRREGPLENDINVPFVLTLRSGVVVMAQPLAFRHYRENALDIWGEHGRLSIVQEGLQMVTFRRVDNRAMQGERELENDAGHAETTTIGEAFRDIYDDLAAALSADREPISSAESALATERVVHAIRDSARRVGIGAD